ncbi:MAG: undecaprenyl/decaprenyl-phosphate alpha-N-acetylglucosaminyl 1-phosphate transferase [Candidatus Hydrogenedens sp.]|nr:undecaprenyl/decaprenyl-phosphate alpha-N-acetylglucosaminyl 1-phosphate transferase [Candidatus Hydrogenedens sp.]
MIPRQYLVFSYLLVLSFVLSLALTWLMKRCARRWGVLDHPAGRKSHEESTPLLGGAAIFLTFYIVLISHVVAVSYLWPWGPAWLAEKLAILLGEDHGKKLVGILLAGVMIFILGIIDDLHVLRPWFKLLGQIASALVLVLFGMRIHLFYLHDIYSSSFVTVLWIVLIVNSMNLLDNMDGLSGGVSIIAAITFFLSVQPYDTGFMVRFLLVIFAGAVGGFLFFNLPPAQIFMGDAGAMFNGYLLATVAVVGTFHIEGVNSRAAVVSPVLALSVPLFDTLSVVWIRWRNGDSIMLGDKRHFSHRLVEVGMRPSMAVYFIYMVAALVGLNGALLPMLSLTGTGIILAQTVGIFLLIVLLMNAGKRNGSDQV